MTPALFARLLALGFVPGERNPDEWAVAELERVTGEARRLRDLVRHERGPLHDAELITDEEYAALAGDESEGEEAAARCRRAAPCRRCFRRRGQDAGDRCCGSERGSQRCCCAAGPARHRVEGRAQPPCRHGATMTDRYCAFTVVLDHEIREDDAEWIINAISMIKGVRTVEPVTSTPEVLFAEMKVRAELRAKLIDMLRDKQEPR